MYSSIGQSLLVVNRRIFGFLIRQFWWKLPIGKMGLRNNYGVEGSLFYEVMFFGISHQRHPAT